MGSLYGFEIKSEVPLRRLNSAPGRRGELRIEVVEGSLPEPDRGPAGALEDETGHRWYASYELEGGDVLLQMPPTGSFAIEPGRGRVLVESTNEDAELLEHRIASSAICVLLTKRGDVVLHAAAIEAGAGAVLFCGPSLRGKSTLVRALGAAGHRLVGEDGIAIELSASGPRVHPAARGVRVRNGGEGMGSPIELLPDPGPGEPDPCGVAAIVVLGERSDGLSLERLEPAQGLLRLTPSLMHSGGRRSIAGAFAGLAQALASVPVFSASLPDDLAAVSDSARELLDLIEAGG